MKEQTSSRQIKPKPSFRERHYKLYLILKLVTPVILVVLVLTLIAAIMVFRSMIYPEIPEEMVSPEDYHMYAEDIIWAGFGNTRRNGLYIRGSNLAPLIVLCHSYGENRVEDLSLAGRLRDAGYNIFIYTLLGHSHGDNSPASLGVVDIQDMREALELLIQKPEVDFTRIGIYGSSTGAYVALQMGLTDPNVKVLILDSVYSKPDFLIQSLARRKLGFKSSVINTLCRYFFSLYFGVSDSVLTEEIPRDGLSAKKILFITSSDRRNADLSKETRHLYSYINCDKKDIINLPFSKSDLYGQDRYQYDQHILNFFEQELNPEE